MADNEFAALEQWIGTITQGLQPGQRRSLALRIGRTLRRSNAQRIAANEQPDGSAMEGRKPRRSRSGRVKKRGKMFRKLRLIRNMTVRATPDDVELAFTSGPGRVAAVHQFGQTDTVGRDGRRRPIRVRYAARRLLGFGNDDINEIAEAVNAHLNPSL